MKTKLIAAAIFCAMASPTAVVQSADPLPSWNESKAKQSITDFVGKVTKPGSPDFVPPSERIATFDNDGTLWAEQPMYFQLLFALDRVKALAPQHPEWKSKEPFASLLKGDVKGALAGGQQAMQLISVWCPYCLCHHTHGIDAAMPSWAIAHRPGGRTPFDQIGNQKWHRWHWSGTIYPVPRQHSIYGPLRALAQRHRVY